MNEIVAVLPVDGSSVCPADAESVVNVLLSVEPSTDSVSVRTPT